MDGAIVYRPPNNPYVDRYIARARGEKRLQAEQIGKHNGARRIFSLLRGGKAILLLVDQKTNEGVAAPFFGRDAMTTPAPAALALKLKVPVVFASNQRLGGARFRITVHPPLEFAPSGDIDARCAGDDGGDQLRLEEMVRADPANGCGFTGAGRRRRIWTGKALKRVGLGLAGRARRIELHLEPVHRPVQMRAGGAAGLADHGRSTGRASPHRPPSPAACDWCR